ncbi:MAG: cysteine desulfurase family protein [Chlamydiales bacterium]|nr:cysteine desulfurase family protein [Chlamydiales bacterium]
MKRTIYLDNNATTPLDPKVIQAITHCLKHDFGNPSSPYTLGRQSRVLVDEARRNVASYLGVRPRELIFTSSGTEALNTLIRGICSGRPPGHIVTSSVEHSAVFATVQEMERAGWNVTFLAPGSFGSVSAQAVHSAITPHTALIAIMAVNNETGVKTDIDGIATVARETGVPLIVDGVALLGKEPYAIPAGVSAMAFSGHKFHGPKGIGLLCMRGRLKVAPLITGGGQEFGLRAGTENVPGIVGLATALELVREELPHATERMRVLRDRFEAEIRGAISDVVVNGEGPRICNTSNLAFLGVDGEALLINLDQHGIAASHGSACSTGALEPSRILTNMGVPLEQARSSLRFSLSRLTTDEEVDEAIQIIIDCVKRLR